MQAVAPLDCLACLPGAPGKANRGAAALHGQLLAYAAGPTVVVCDAQRMAVATTLSGAHRQASVAALDWHPGGGPREPRAAAQLRLASGDEDGRVMVWNVNTGAVIAALEDPWGSAFGSSGGRRPEGAPGGRPPVVGLAWATAAPSVLAVLLAPCILLLWDYRTGGIVWKKDFGSGPGAEPFTGLQVDPLDRRRLVLCGSRGSFVVLCLVHTAADRVQQQQYQVDLGSGGTLRCAFSGTQDLLFVLLQREIIVFDLEYGQPAASTPLPASRAPLDDLLGCYGHAAAGKSLQAGGLDVLYCSHRDGSLSVWQRHPRLLTYVCLGATKLMPPVSKFGTAPTVLALAAGLWHGLEAAPASDAAAEVGALLSAGGRRHPGAARRVPSAPNHNSRSSTDGAEGSAGDIDEAAAGRCVLLMGAASDGRVWQWQVPLLAGALPDPKPAALPAAPKPELLGLLHTLPQRVTAFSVCPLPVPLPGSAGAVAAVAAATAAGTVEVVTVQQGALLPLHLSVGASLAVHLAPVQGLRWLGSTSRLVSFSSEKVAQGYKNTLLLTDVRNRVSLPFRDSTSDPVPLAGLRASPSGRYLLVLFRGAPSEIWSVGAGCQPSRLRQVDLQFTALEWLDAEGQAGGASPGSAAGPWAASPRAAERAAAGYAFQPDTEQEEPPEERLAFSLADGRTGVLGIRGRRISDTRPRRPTWQQLATGDFRAVALGSWGSSVLLGDAEGSLVHWDTATGRCSVLDTGLGRVHKIYTSAPPSEALYPRLPGANAVVARVAVLFASGVFAAYDLDQMGELWATHVTGTAAAARVGRATDIEWLQLPGPVGGGAVLAASLEDGSLALFDTVHSMDVRPRRARMQRYRSLLHSPPPPELAGTPWSLVPGPPVAAAPLLPHAWALLLRLLLQRGLPESAFRELAALAASIGRGGGAAGAPLLAGSGMAVDTEMALEKLEDEIWSRLPRGCQVAWATLLAQRGDAGEGPAAGAGLGLMQILEKFSGESDEDESGEGGSSEGSSARTSRPQSAAAPPAVEQQRNEPAFEGTAVRDEAAAAALGLTSRQGSATGGAPGGGSRRREKAAATFKSLGGAFKGMAKDVASAGRSQLRSLAGGDRGQAPLVAAVAGISDGYEYSQATAGSESLVAVLHAIATARGQPAVLSPAELAAYAAALSRHRVADRMALAAELVGEEEEALFWRRLPATLAWLNAALAAARRRSAAGDARIGAGSGAPSRSSPDSGPPSEPPRRRSSSAPVGAAGPGGVTLLWDEALEMAEAVERSGWHEQMNRRIFEGSEDLQEKRVLEYVALGDFQTAVGFLLASPPERSARYYRDALCVLGMAFACGLQGMQRQASTGAIGGAAAGEAASAAPQMDSAARTLFVQAAKVITANAASVGDTLLGVPLLCSTGQHADAAGLLQDSGLWRYASALIAHSLRGAERAAAIERWAGHVAAAEGRPWAAAGLLLAAGALKAALQLLRQHGLPDAAAALVTACKEADLPLQQHNLETGELANLWEPVSGRGSTGSSGVPRYSASGERLEDATGGGVGKGGAQLQRAGTLTDWERSETARDFQLYVCEVLQQL